MQLKNKSEINAYYAEDARVRKAEYEAENGSAKGWKKSKSYKQNRRNKAQTLRRYKKRKELKQIPSFEAQRELDQKTEEEKQEDSQKAKYPIVDLIQPTAPYHSVLGYGSRIGKTAKEKFGIKTKYQSFADNPNEFKVVKMVIEHIARPSATEDKLGNPPTRLIYDTQITADLGLKRAYLRGVDIQKRTGDSLGMEVTATVVETARNIFINVFCENVSE